MMTTRQRRRLHIALAIFFAVQFPPWLWLALYRKKFFAEWWEIYLIFISIYAIVSTHWAGASAETPFEETEEAGND